MKIKIDKGIPLPPRRIASTTYPFDSLHVGESFIAGKYSREKMQQVASAISHYQGKFSDKKFTQRRTEDNQIRVWREK